MSDNEVQNSNPISKEEKNNELILNIDLDKADLLKNKQPLLLDIPIEDVTIYLPGLLPFDGYEGVRNWYRKNIIKSKQLFAVHISDLKNLLQASCNDAVKYLVAPRNERCKNQVWGWLNEAVLIDEWIFPAYALEKARVTEDFAYNKITMKLKRGGKDVGEVSYNIGSSKRIEYQDPVKI